HRVAQVIHAVHVDNIDVLRVEPVAWPWVNKSEPIATVMEAAPPVVGLADTERVLPSKVGPVTVFRNAATTASTGSLFLLLLLLRMLLLLLVLFLLLLLLSMLLLLLVLFLLLLLLSMLLLVLVLLLLLLSML